MESAEINNKSAEYAGNGYWNDPDMMVIGNRGLTNDEQVSHFALWSIMNAPLMLGNDPRNMSAEEDQLILNKEIIAIDQDNGQQGVLVKKKPDYQIWKKRMKDGSTSLLLLNLNGKSQLKVVADFKELDLPSVITIRDVTHKEDLGKFRNKFSSTLSPHASCLIRIKKYLINTN